MPLNDKSKNDGDKISFFLKSRSGKNNALAKRS